MKKSKPILVIAGTLLIGFVLGFFVSGYLTNHKIKTFMRWTDKEEFVNRIYYRIDASDEQKKQLYPVLQKYSDKSTECLDRHKIIIDSMRTELKTYLTPEQMQKLDKCMGCKGETCSPKKNNCKME
jgi:nitrate/TMAO reductase-like tetraheme cytochrome c subunit